MLTPTYKLVQRLLEAKRDLELERYNRLLTAGMITGEQLCKRFGVKRTTLGRWRTQGLVRARICNSKGQWLYWPPEHDPRSHESKAKPAAKDSEDS